MEDSVILASTLIIAAASLLLLKRKKKRRFGIRSIYRKRLQYGEYHHLVLEMRLTDHESFYQYFRMTPARFDNLLSKIGPYISRSSFRSPLSEGERLAVTLRYLASGDSQRSLSFHYQISQAAVSILIREVCNAIWEALCSNYLKVPTIQEWMRIEKDFRILWNFPNCIGSMDGKHCVMQAPNNAGSDYFNYKGSHSIVLLAVSDANYCFTLVSIGEVGRKSDSGVLSNSAFGQALANGTLLLPPPKPLPNTDIIMPHVFVADEAFPLRTYMMRPYPGRQQPLSNIKNIFNYRLSRSRRVVENAFGILAARWRIYRRPIIAAVETVEAIVKATVVLHNFLKLCDINERQTSRQYCPPGYIDHEDCHGQVHEGEWRSQITPNDSLRDVVHSVGSNMYSRDSKLIRDKFADYFNSPEGSLPWQGNIIHRGSIY